jgi:hypothetical protein
VSGDKVKLRLLREHYMNGMQKRSGTVIRLDPWAAKWLVGRGAAVVLKEPTRATETRRTQ